MPSRCLIELEVVDEAIDLVVSDPDSLTIEDGEYIPYRDESYPHYDGPYEVTPLARERTVLQTAHLLMEEDVTVVEVPYWETSNEAGGTTVYIAQEA